MSRLRAPSLLRQIARAIEALSEARDEGSIRTLQAHTGSSRADAERLYHLARRDGYGAAWTAVFPAEPRSRAVPGHRTTARREGGPAS